MPSPSSALYTLRPDLGGSMEEFDTAADRLNFIGYQVAPVIEVSLAADSPGIIPMEQLLKKHGSLARAPGAGYSRDSFTFSKWSYATQEYGMEELVSDKDARRYRYYFDAELVAAERARDAVLREAEKRIAALIFNTTTWTGATLTTAVGTPWSTVATATPIANVNAACQKVWDLTGMWPNALICNRKVFKNLRLCDEVKDAIASTGAGDSVLQGRISARQIAEALDLDMILVGGSPKNTADEGQTGSISPIWSDSYAMVARIARTNDIREPCVARSFHWSDDGSAVGAAIESYRDEAVRSDVLRARHDVDEVVMYKELAHRLSNIT